jgi:hypothetical protein
MLTGPPPKFHGARDIFVCVAAMSCRLVIGEDIPTGTGNAIRYLDGVTRRCTQPSQGAQAGLESAAIGPGG